MDAAGKIWYFSDMALHPIPSWHLFGEHQAFPDILHIERIKDRAAGLDWVIAPHRHVHLHQIFLLVSGQVRLSIDGSPRRFGPPVLINIPRGTVHEFVFSAGADGFVLTLPASDFPDLFGPTAETAPALSGSFSLHGDPFLSRFAAIFAAHAGRAPFRRTVLRGETTALVADILGQAPLGPQPHRTDPRFQQFDAILRASLSTSHRMEDLAAALSLSPRHLGRLCKAETGLSAQTYILSLKMHEACRLLVYTRMSAQQVAYHLGFEDPAYFSRAFKRSLTLSPTTYRAQFDGPDMGARQS